MQHASTAPLTPRYTFVPNSRAASPESGGGAHKRRRHQSSRYLGVSWDKTKSSWRAVLSKHNLFIGRYNSEEDAARAYDFAAVQARGPGAKRNFPGEAISEPPVSKGEEKRQKSSSRYLGVIWDKAKSSWKVQMMDPQQAAHWVLLLRGGRSTGVRPCGCAGAWTRRQAQLPGRGHPRAACEQG
jgi:hypothetical protein